MVLLDKRRARRNEWRIKETSPQNTPLVFSSWHSNNMHSQSCLWLCIVAAGFSFLMEAFINSTAGIWEG
ncbi:MAG: hypothetical protein AB9895_01200 [Negativicutes bacterium]